MLASLMIVISAAPAATWRHAPSLPRLAERSECVVTGVVRSATSADAPWGLVTTYEIDVEATLAGTPRRSVTVALPGGRTDGGLAQVWSGVPLWAEGDEVLVFVPRDDRMPLNGVFDLRDHAVLDPMGRWGQRVVFDSDLPALLREP